MSNKWGLTPIVFLVACATPPANDNFRQVMQRQVGKSVDDSDFYPTLYRLRQTNSQRLPNGNFKEEYAAGRAGKCKVSFEVNTEARRVIGWSADGDPEDCVIDRPGR